MKYSLYRGLRHTESWFRCNMHPRKIVGTFVAMLENRLHILKTFCTWLLPPATRTSVYFCWMFIVSNIFSGMMETEQQASRRPRTKITPELPHLRSAFFHPLFTTRQLLTRTKWFKKATKYLIDSSCPASNRCKDSRRSSAQARFAKQKRDRRLTQLSFFTILH